MRGHQMTVGGLHAALIDIYFMTYFCLLSLNTVSGVS